MCHHHPLQNKEQDMNTIKRLLSLVYLLAAALLLSACERPPVEAVQNGFRGTGMAIVYNPRTLEAQAEKNEVPPGIPADPNGPKAGAVYKNVKVLGNLSVAQFTNFMVAMTSWVAPEQGCSYCHNVANFAEDAVYTKIVSRKMIQMTQRINVEWKSHVAETGVTCYTCHRGNNIPQNVWFTDPAKPQGSGF
jgi:photosynthetic reaction center cytochrome c subunit